MNRILYYTIIIGIVWCFSSCKEMDSIYKEYIVPNGYTYPGKAMNPVVYAGKNRVKISWPNGSDQSVSKARIFWNNYTDSAEIDISSERDTISYILENLLEGSYSFIIKTYDQKGNSSIPVEVSGNSYGENYQAGLLNRMPFSSEVDHEGALNIQWEGADISNGFLRTEVRYIDKDGTSKLKFFQDGSSKLSDYKTGTSFQYRTLYIPAPLSVDTFYTAFDEAMVSEAIDKSNWTATARTYERFAQMPNGPAEKAIDNDVTTYWHSNHTELITGYPYWLAVDMKAPVVVTRVELTNRLAYYTENFIEFIIQGSTDGIEWTDYGTFNFQGITTTQSFKISDAPAIRYIRIYMVRGITVHAYLAEFSVFGIK